MGLNAREGFFLEDGIILVEGQEDVLCYQKIARQLNLEFNGTFFGWGAGGSEKIPLFCELFKELGFKNIVVILDGNKVSEIPSLKIKYPTFNFTSISENDIRDKPATPAKNPIAGMVSSGGTIHANHQAELKSLINQVNAWLD